MLDVHLVRGFWWALHTKRGVAGGYEIRLAITDSCIAGQHEVVGGESGVNFVPPIP